MEENGLQAKTVSYISLSLKPEKMSIYHHNSKDIFLLKPMLTSSNILLTTLITKSGAKIQSTTGTVFYQWILEANINFL